MAPVVTTSLTIGNGGAEIHRSWADLRPLVELTGRSLAGVEAAFESSLLLGARSALRAICIIAVVAFACLLGAAWFFAEGRLGTFVMTSLTVMLAMTVVFLTTYSESGLRHISALAMIACASTGAGVVALAAASGNGTGRYHEALIIVFLAFSLMAPWSWRSAVVLYSSLVLLYDAVILAAGQLGPPSVWVPNNFVLWSCVVVAVSSMRRAKRLRRQEFLARTALEERGSALKEASIRLTATVEKLHQADNHKDEFLSNVSHELRTPLTLILSPLEALLADPTLASSPALVERLRLMRRNAARLLRLINSLLDFAKLDAGRMQVERTAVDPAPFLADILHGFQELAQHKGVRLVLLDGAPGPVMLDAEKVETIAQNLLANAIKFTPRGGSVTLGNGRDGSAFWIEVGDTGIGIPAAERRRVFERFAQADGGARRGVNGTGIGLALSRELALVQGGSLTVEEADLGCKLRLSVPDIVPQPGEWRAALTAKQAGFPEDPPVPWFDEVPAWSSPPATRGEPAVKPPAGRILVVEDSVDMRRLLSDILGQRYEVITANDGVEGLDRAVHTSPDAIVSDIIMPNMSGYEMTHLLKANPATEHIPVILLTAMRDVHSTVEGFARGADDKLGKPFHPEELLARVGARVEVKKLQDALREKSARLEELARIDMVTGVANRRYLLESFQRQLDAAARRQGVVSFVMVDIDHFKEINDGSGHEIGDQALASIAGALQQCLRTQDLLGRYGGDEFGMILPDTDLAGAALLSERCRKAVEASVLTVGATTWRFTVSLGVACSPKGSTAGPELIRRADAALYYAKRSGRNRAVCAEMTESSSAA